MKHSRLWSIVALAAIGLFSVGAPPRFVGAQQPVPPTPAPTPTPVPVPPAPQPAPIPPAPAPQLPPSITVPATITFPQPGLVFVRATALNADDVRWWTKGGVQVFPSDILQPPLGTFAGLVMAPGTYKIGVVAAKAVDGKAVISQPAEVTIVVEGVQPLPPIPPGPTPVPPGPTPPGPVSPTKLFVVIVEETADAVASRGVMLSDPTLARRMAEKGHKFRVIDKDVADAKGNPPADVKPLLDRAKGKAYPQLYLVDETGVIRFEGDLPKSPGELIGAMQKVGG